MNLKSEGKHGKCAIPEIYCFIKKNSNLTYFLFVNEVKEDKSIAKRDGEKNLNIEPVFIVRFGRFFLC